jgi:exopolysaccharide biosynthesis polyprenyl glycosylphosphotransferase
MYTGGLLVTDGGTGTSQAVLAAADVAIPPSAATCEWDFTRRFGRERPAGFRARSVDLNNVVAARTGAGGRAETAARRPRLRRVRQTVKAVFDRAAAALLLLVFLPVLVGVGLLVRFSSKGPALFTQTRIGRNGRAFRMVKFRSMVVDAESRLDDLAAGNEQDGPLFKIREDPRITPVGRVLRRFSLDELPQLFNVLSGSMSLVGPRPPLPCEVATYGDDVWERLRVKPGITGLWQVSGRSDLSWEESVRLDLHYVNSWSLWLDMVVLCKTARAVLRAEGAY